MSWSSGTSYDVPEFTGREVCELHFLSPAVDFIAPEPGPAKPGAAPGAAGT
jgi:hypothetical protein